MLAVKKEETEPTDTNAPAAGGFGKVLGSIQGLQQRLSDFSYGEVSIAEAKVKLLVEQLVLLRENLNNLAWLKQAFSETYQRVSAIPAENFDQVNLANLEKHPQLHALVQASKLMRVQRLMKAQRARADRVSLDMETTELRVVTLAEQDIAAQTRIEKAQPIDKIGFPQAHGLTSATPADTIVDESAPVANDTAPAKPEETLSVGLAEQSFTIPAEKIAGAQDDRASAKPTDWTFDFDDASLTSTESSADPINFEFPPETLSEHENPSRHSATSNFRLSGPSATAKATPARQTGPLSVAVSEPVVPQPISPDKAPVPTAEAKLDESKALVPANHDFDQRLLDEVIKNYGDFAITPNLPAIVEAPKQIRPIDDQSTAQTEPRFGKPIAEERKVPKARRDRDLDRQLKKIIKDYGENDLYQRQSIVNLKTGGIAAFVVLGLVLGALYLFKAPQSATPVQTRPAAQPQEAERADSAEAATPDKSAGGVNARLAGPDAANASTSPLPDTKQKP